MRVAREVMHFRAGPALGVANQRDAKDGVTAYKIAAHAADLARELRGEGGPCVA